MDLWSKHLTASQGILGLTKTAQEQEGHWRKLPAHYKGKDSAGAPVTGKTWVRKSRIKKWFKPYAHQKSFIDEVTSLPPEEGVIAAHGTGTGKTVSSVAAFEKLKGQGKAKRALVVAPAGLRDNFLKKGVNKFTDSKGVVLKNANQEVGDDVEYVITSYTSFRNNPKAYIDKYKPDVLIADEAHKAVNTDSATYKAMYSARQKIPYFMGLTASSVQNNPTDLAPLLSIAKKGEQPHPLADKRAISKYVRKVKTEQRGIFGGETFEKMLVDQPKLRKLIGANVHYIEDLDASKKPVKDAETVEVTMTDTQHAMYKKALKGVDPRIQAKIAKGEEVTDKEAKSLFVRLIYARRVSNSLYGHVPNMSLEEAAEKTPKIKKILDDTMEHLSENSDGQVVMYTNFINGGVDVLEAGLKKKGIPYGVFAGKSKKGMTEEKRQKAVDDYLKGDNKVIIITAAGAEGLSLGNTTMVQMVDGHYNPERMSQAEARGIRAGGLSHRAPEDRKVKVKRYVTKQPKGFWRTITFQDSPKSIDEFVYLTADRKKRINKQVRKVLADNTKIRDYEKKSVLYKYFGIKL